MSDMKVVSNYLDVCDKASKAGLEVGMQDGPNWFTVDKSSGVEMVALTSLDLVDKFIQGYMWGKLA
jgi:hypothetical protein